MVFFWVFPQRNPFRVERVVSTKWAGAMPSLSKPVPFIPWKRPLPERECIAARWSTRELERQISSLLFDRLALSQSGEKVRSVAQSRVETFEP